MSIKKKDIEKVKKHLVIMGVFRLIRWLIIFIFIAVFSYYLGFRFEMLY